MNDAMARAAMDSLHDTALDIVTQWFSWLGPEARAEAEQERTKLGNAIYSALVKAAGFDEDDDGEDAKPTLLRLGNAVFWRGDGIVLADMPAGHACMVYREAGGWLVGTKAALDEAKRLIDAQREHAAVSSPVEGA